MSDKDASSPDEVGYKKPPKNTQFPPGETGNPKGRPKKVKEKSFLDDAAAELEAKVLITENGIKTKVTKTEFVAKNLVNRALKKDPKALALIIKLLVSWAEETRKERAQEPETKFIWKNRKMIDGEWKLV